MPPPNINDPKVSKFLVESYEKEFNLRNRWNEKHKNQLKECAVFKKEPKNYLETDVLINNMAWGMDTARRDHVASAYNRRKIPIRDGTFIPGVKDMRRGHSIADVDLGDPKEDPRLQRPDTDLTPDPVMRPIDPATRRIIHEGLPENGRLKYLDVRNHIWPEKKYYFAECSSWVYGWRITDSKATTRASHGRVWHLTNALRRNRVGPQPDPDHYIAPDNT